MAAAILKAPQTNQMEIEAQRGRIAALKVALAASSDPAAKRLMTMADYLVKKSV
jgi:pyruvate-ferredoxin/flavodoxin oxidoreductase